MAQIQQFEEGTTLDRFIFETTRVHRDAQGQFATLLQQMALAARLVSAELTEPVWQVFPEQQENRTFKEILYKN